MVEFIRAHERISAESCLGERTIWKLEDKSVQLFVPQEYTSKTCYLLIHFHGLGFF